MAAVTSGMAQQALASFYPKILRMAIAARRAHGKVAQPGAIALLAALLKRNTTLQELDLSAADVENPGARALAAVLPLNGTLSSLRLPFNPALDEKSKDALRSAARERDLLLQLEL